MENIIYFNLYGILNVCTFLNLVLLYVAYYLSIVEKRLEKFAFIAKVENRDLLFFFFLKYYKDKNIIHIYNFTFKKLEATFDSTL